MGAHLVFVDESGFLLIPHVRKTWAPRGRTPILRHRYRHGKVSVISGLSVSPKARRVGLYFRFHLKNIQHPEVCGFLRHLLKHLRGPVIVVWDNGQIHKGEPIHAVLRRHPRLHLEFLPSYAPELNPDEGVWTHAKRELSNGRPEEVSELAETVVRVLCELSMSQANLRGCVLQSDLPPFLPNP